ncbi:DNA (cytosine-5-)-methyltransferase [Hyphobacterium sp. HN65]|uniref:DNA (cytosine-5-)-methyltransferase n=1 Tax=Hyphobacterium lacteum TaxID=3116575 RepID=A0ABU7LRF2_9PROT|nr:DNA (cytosine-5-)-methyltransferase [Hyphobacterium sp. HN65]MEE2526497.1 DNA (cytosine-5-)-methyltransferase [Hyphobacterium sp. HN65]
MEGEIRVVDLFAGPGGLAEGFSSVLNENGDRVFKVVTSVEKEASAHKTLTLRAFTRQFKYRQLPDTYYEFANALSREESDRAFLKLKQTNPVEWEAAVWETLYSPKELGNPADDEAVGERLESLLTDKANGGADIVVIGGPPCQAYSLVGRSRNLGKTSYVAEEDSRHFLYQEYVRILDRLSPAAFVMENVKGMLSSSIAGRRIFAQVREDLENAGTVGGGYQLVAMSPNRNEGLLFNDQLEDRDFLIRSERHGVPQARHRIIIVGIRKDLFRKAKIDPMKTFMPERSKPCANVGDVLSGLPPLRSGLSRDDSPENWRNTVLEGMDLVIQSASGSLIEAARSAKRNFQSSNSILPRSSTEYPIGSIQNPELREFIEDENLSILKGHETRGHMASDIARYFFCSVFMGLNGRPAKADDFPQKLAPNHKNWSSGKFADRFRVQGWLNPSTTIVSHIAKDGHYFIHPDPAQCRSLTVREAARLQTFPDNYLFLGNRTEQFVQVGNAVPPLLAKQIGEAVMGILLPNH